jgi:esterase/lipase superfamily enzyme
MHREYHKWYSPHLHRDMELLIHGHAGARMLVFPTSKGRYYEYEDRGMVAALGDKIDAGQLQLYCVDSVDAESFYNWNAHPGWRVWRHVQYEEYLLNEVLPLSRSRNNNPFMISHGCSFGAYHAVNIALRHPYWFGRVLACSGKYDMSSFFSGYYNDQIYLNTPSHFVGNLPDGPQLDALRRMDIIIAVGRDDPNIADNRAFSAALWSRNIWHAFREWDGWSHDWPYWTNMVRTYINGSD